MPDEARRTLSPDSEEYRMRVNGSKTQVIGWSLYTCLLWQLKTCMAVFYSRLTDGLVNMRWRVRFAYILIGTTYIATVLSILLGCHPMHKNWQIYPNPGNHCQPAISEIDVYVTVVLNVATDIYLITIPTPILFKARLPIHEKLELLVLFSGGIFVMVAGILRAVLIVTAGPNGAQQAGSWACRETFVAIVVNNAPIVYPTIRRALRSPNGWSSFTHSLKCHLLGSRYQSQSSAYGEGYPRSTSTKDIAMSKRSEKRRRFRHPLSLPTNTYTTRIPTLTDSQWDNLSEEQMILPTFRQQPPTIAAGSVDSFYSEGIKVTQETIVESREKKRANITVK